MIVPAVEFEHRRGEIIFGGNMLNLALGMLGLRYVRNTPVRYIQHRGPHMSLRPENMSAPETVMGILGLYVAEKNRVRRKISE